MNEPRVFTNPDQALDHLVQAVVRASSRIVKSGVLREAVVLPGDTPRYLAHIRFADGTEAGAHLADCFWPDDGELTAMLCAAEQFKPASAPAQLLH